MPACAIDGIATKTPETTKNIAANSQQRTRRVMTLTSLLGLTQKLTRIRRGGDFRLDRAEVTGSPWPAGVTARECQSNSRQKTSRRPARLHQRTSATTYAGPGVWLEAVQSRQATVRTRAAFQEYGETQGEEP
jgi:hypothetical protein